MGGELCRLCGGEDKPFIEVSANRVYLAMRFLLSGLLLAAALFISGCKKDNSQKVHIKAICYNVAGLPEIISSSSPETYTTSISRLLNEYDVVHLQEDFCYNDSIMLYNEHPFGTDHIGCVPDGDGLFGLSNYPIKNVDRHAWTECTGADCLTPKGFYFSQIELLEGKTVDFYNVHCNAGGGEESLEARRGNLNQLIGYINENSSGNPIIIMGDFNSRYTREGDTIRALLDLGFSDLWLELVRSGNVPPLDPTKLKECDPDRTGYNCELVDKIFYRSTADVKIKPLKFQADDSRFYYNGIDSLDLSDHWPLFADFEIEFK